MLNDPVLLAEMKLQAARVSLASAQALVKMNAASTSHAAVAAAAARVAKAEADVKAAESALARTVADVRAAGAAAQADADREIAEHLAALEALTPDVLAHVDALGRLQLKARLTALPIPQSSTSPLIGASSLTGIRPAFDAAYRAREGDGTARALTPEEVSAAQPHSRQRTRGNN